MNKKVRILLTLALSTSILAAGCGSTRDQAGSEKTFTYGTMAYALYSIAVAHANDHAKGDFVRVSSGLLLLYGFGTMIGPVIGAHCGPGTVAICFFGKERPC